MSIANEPVEIPARLLNVDDICQLTGTARNTVRAWFKCGKLPPPVRIGRRYYWRPEQIRDLIGARAEGGAA